MYGENLLDLDAHKSIPTFFSKNNTLHDEEVRLRKEQEDNNARKLKRHHIDTVDIDNIESIPEKIIDLLERHKYGGSRHK